MERNINNDEWNVLKSRLKDTGIELERPLHSPEEYHSFRDYAAEKRYQNGKDTVTTRFASIPAVIEAAWKLVRFFKILQEENMFCVDDLKENVYFHAKTGKMVFKDPDGLRKWEEIPEEAALDGTAEIPPKEAGDVLKYRESFHAPEQVLGKVRENSRDTQNWSLAVYLYELFYHSGSPFSGHLSMKQVFFSKEEEILWMAGEGIFTMEDDSCKNRPVHGVQDRLIRYWEHYPQVLRDIFTQIFVEGKEDVQKRCTPLEWQQVLNRLKTQYLTCKCGAKGFLSGFVQNPQGYYQCPKCGNIFYVLSTQDNEIYLSTSDETRIFRWQVFPEKSENQEVLGVVMENRQHKGVYGIKNMSSETWMGVFPNGEERPVGPGGGIPLWKGLQITFQEGNTWRIKGEV